MTGDSPDGESERNRIRVERLVHPLTPPLHMAFCERNRLIVLGLKYNFSKTDTEEALNFSCFAFGFTAFPCNCAVQYYVPTPAL